MDAIKKKMQAMKLEKDNATDKADTCEGQAKDANLRADKINEEVRDLQKKLTQIEIDLVNNKNALEKANKDLEDKDKALTAVSTYPLTVDPCHFMKSYRMPSVSIRTPFPFPILSHLGFIPVR